MQLHNRIAVVTGAAQNIGLAIAERFIAAGATVVMADYNPQTLQVSATQLGERAYPVDCDLRQIAECKRLVGETEARFGRVDIVVNNAYKGAYQPLDRLTDEDWHNEIAIGLTAMMAICRAALPGMLARKHGVFVNTGSINSFCPSSSMAAYATVKGGILNFTRQIAVDYGYRGIRANSICPGYITNPQREREFAEKPLERARVEATIPLRRVGTNTDIAEVVLFLASDSSAFITGQSLLVDGGASIQNGKMVTWPFQEALEAQG